MTRPHRTKISEMVQKVLALKNKYEQLAHRTGAVGDYRKASIYGQVADDLDRLINKNLG